MFSCLPNLKKLVLDYNLLTHLPKLDDGPDVMTRGDILSKLNHFSVANNKLSDFPI